MLAIYTCKLIPTWWRPGSLCLLTSKNCDLRRWKQEIWCCLKILKPETKCQEQSMSVIQLSCTTDHIKVQTKTCAVYVCYILWNYFWSLVACFTICLLRNYKQPSYVLPQFKTHHVHWDWILLISKMLSLLWVHDGESFLYFRFERRWFESSIELIPQSVNWMSQVISDKWSWNNFSRFY